MKLALLAPRNSVHTVRWANAFADRGHDVHLISCHDGDLALRPGITFHRLPFQAPLGYVTNVVALRKLLAKMKPDVMNVHYASGYGLLGFLTGFHPLCLNVWGSDVYEFPYRNPLNRRLIRSILGGADRVASTSQAMAEQAAGLFASRRPIVITPFGVETDVFKPRGENGTGEPITVGTAKILAPIYGQTILIEGFAQAMRDIEANQADVARRMRLLIIGDGPSRGDLEAQCRRLAIADRVSFTGAVDFRKIASYLEKLDVFAALTLANESFGVAVVEASACGLPVVVSDTPGFREVVVDGKSGFIVPKNDVSATKDALKRLILDADLRQTMGRYGREDVKRRFEWSTCVDRLEGLLRSMARQPGSAP